MLEPSRSLDSYPRQYLTSGASPASARCVEDHAGSLAIAGTHGCMDIFVGDAEIVEAIGIESEKALQRIAAGAIGIHTGEPCKDGANRVGRHGGRN